MYQSWFSRSHVAKFLGLIGTSNSMKNADDKENSKHSQVSKQEEEIVCGNEQREKAIQSARDRGSRKIVSFMLEKGIPGLTISVSKQGEPVWRAGFGFCDVENLVPCDPDARMRIASISKTIFATTVVAPLVEKKLIDIKSSIHNYLTPDEYPRQKFQGKVYDITIEQLLSHTAGVRSYHERKESEALRPIGSTNSLKVYQDDNQYNREEMFQRRTYRNVIEALETFKNDSLKCEPGTEYNYSTYGYNVLSAVLEKAVQKQVDGMQKKQIEDYWIDILRRDWKLLETNLDQDEPILPKRSRYYMRSAKNGQLINAPYTDLSVKWAGGGLNSTTNDLVKFANKLIDCYKGRDKTLSRETIELFWKEVKRSYALGFMVEKRGGNKEKLAVSHTGGALGASSILLIYPESETVVAIVVNMDTINLTQVALYIADQFAKIEF